MSDSPAAAAGAAPARPLPSPATLPRKERLLAFGEAIDAIRSRVEADLGPAEVAHVKRVNRFSRGMEVSAAG
jgi:hypothetical protein